MQMIHAEQSNLFWVKKVVQILDHNLFDNSKGERLLIILSDFKIFPLIIYFEFIMMYIF